MRWLLPSLLIWSSIPAALPAAGSNKIAAAGDNAPAIRDFASDAAKDFGPPGAAAAAYLIAGMPEADLRQLTREFLLENLRLAMHARTTFPWAKEVPEELFLDCVLPYAQLDEPRDPWRPEFYKLCAAMVKDCKTASEAAQQLNRQLFDKLNVHYNTQRLRPNQSPRESIAQGKASCTGLSIILADACRSVGIPARLAGTAMWTHKSGNHTWVEVWDGQWHFAGAGEPAAEGLDHAWFAGDAANAVADQPLHAIWANTWAPTGQPFPLAWAPASRAVSAVNVTARYAAKTAATKPNQPTVHLRVLDENGQRLATRVELLDSAGKLLDAVTTKAGTADLNDMPALTVPPNNHVLRVVRGDQARDFPQSKPAAGNRTIDLPWANGQPVKGS